MGVAERILTTDQEIANWSALTGTTEAVLAVLEACGLEVPADVREHVLGSTDLAELDH